MTVSSTDLVSAVAKLNDLTRRKLIAWSPTRSSVGDLVVADSYCAPYEGSTIKIAALGNTRAQIRYNHPRSQQQRESPQYRLEILDDQDNSIFVFPAVQGIGDLFSSVRARTSNAEEIIRSLLNAK